jgi:DNA replication protein DnaC
MATEYVIAVEKGVRLPPIRGKRMTSLQTKGDIRNKKGDAAVTPTINNRQKEPSVTTSSPDEFAEFWQAYPRKEGRSKALRAWRRVKAAQKDAVFASLEVWKRSQQWCRGGGQYIPHASTFLSQERWKERPHEFSTGGMNEKSTAEKTERQLSGRHRFDGVGRKATDTLG